MDFIMHVHDNICLMQIIGADFVHMKLSSLLSYNINLISRGISLACRYTVKGVSPLTHVCFGHLAWHFACLLFLIHLSFRQLGAGQTSPMKLLLWCKHEFKCLNDYLACICPIYMPRTVNSLHWKIDTHIVVLLPLDTQAGGSTWP